MYALHYEQKIFVLAEHGPVLMLLGISFWRLRRREREARLARRFATSEHAPAAGEPETTLARSPDIAVIIPALNEEKSIGRVLAAIPNWVRQVIVVDNGSTDSTASVARLHGATVISEPKRGYGAACLAGIGALKEPEIVVFMDGDFSDSPEELPRLISPILRHEADLVIGSRVKGRCERGALTPPQRFGNLLACGLLRLFHRVQYSDLGPFRAIRRSTLERLKLNDTGYGWTIQMQVRAACMEVRGCEVPVSYRTRIGRSKISGTIRGVLGAGTKILYTLIRETMAMNKSGSAKQLIVFTRYPEAGRTKTRMIPALGAEGAADLQRQMTALMLQQAKTLWQNSGVSVSVRFAGGTESAMRKLYDADVNFIPQGDGNLGDRMARAAREGFDLGMESVVLAGSDCPDLTSELMAQAFDRLSSHDIVLGPAEDGGYYLIGMRHPWPLLFDAIDWGTEKVLQQTLLAAKRMGLSVATLPTLRDVDRPEDLSVWGAVRARQPPVPFISVIIPVLNEEGSIATAIDSATSAGVEIIVVDGGSTDQTLAVARAHGASVLSSARGRAKQMNVGAEIARGQVVLFLHADSRLPRDFVRRVRTVLSVPGNVAGAFNLAIEPVTLAMNVVAGAANLRSRWFQLPYGDQAIFLLREQFSKVGGFPEWHVMEDLELKRLGRVAISKARVVTSGRRWQIHGALRMILLNQGIVFAYYLGCPPAMLHEWRESGSLLGFKPDVRRRFVRRHTVELVYDPDCPNVERAREALREAFKRLATAPQWTELNRADPTSPDRAREYGSPTVLVDGQDVAGAAPSAGNSCRIYGNGPGSLKGVPAIEDIVRAIEA